MEHSDKKSSFSVWLILGISAGLSVQVFLSQRETLTAFASSDGQTKTDHRFRRNHLLTDRRISDLYHAREELVESRGNLVFMTFPRTPSKDIDFNMHEILRKRAMRSLLQNDDPTLLNSGDETNDTPLVTHLDSFLHHYVLDSNQSKYLNLAKQSVPADNRKALLYIEIPGYELSTDSKNIYYLKLTNGMVCKAQEKIIPSERSSCKSNLVNTKIVCLSGPAPSDDQRIPEILEGESENCVS